MQTGEDGAETEVHPPLPMLLPLTPEAEKAIEAKYKVKNVVRWPIRFEALTLCAGHNVVQQVVVS